MRTIVSLILLADLWLSKCGLLFLSFHNVNRPLRRMQVTDKPRFHLVVTFIAKHVNPPYFSLRSINENACQCPLLMQKRRPTINFAPGNTHNAYSPLLRLKSINHCHKPADLTVSKRPGTSYRIKIHFAFLSLLSFPL